MCVNECSELSLRGPPPLDVPLLLIRRPGQAGLKLDCVAIEIWLLHFLEAYASLNSFTSDAKLRECRETYNSRHRLSGFVTILHCILLNLVCVEP